MNDLRKAAEMALETLEEINKLSIGEKAICLPAEIDDAMEALRKALAHQALNEMVAENQRLGLYDDAVNISAERVDKTAKREHEPFIYIREDTEMPFGGYEHCGQYDAGAFPVYLAPPKKEWVGLTRRELDIATLGLEDLGDCYLAIEAKLKEKNSG